MVVVYVGGGEVHDLIVFPTKKGIFVQTKILMSAHITLHLDSSEEFIKLLAMLKEAGLDDKIQLSTEMTSSPEKSLKPRKAGWGKGLFSNVAVDFDETPVGFEEYVLPVQNQ